MKSKIPSGSFAGRHFSSFLKGSSKLVTHTIDVEEIALSQIGPKSSSPDAGRPAKGGSTPENWAHVVIRIHFDVVRCQAERMSRRFGISQPDELVNTVWLRLASAVAPSPDRQRHLRYVLKSIRNAAIDIARQQFKSEYKIAKLSEVPESQIPISPPDVPSLTPEDRQTIKSALKDLDHQQLALIKLVYYRDRSLRDAAAILGIPKSSAHRLLSSALTRLAVRLSSLK